MKKLKIAFVTSEISPFSFAGGLSEVARSLPISLHKLGHEIIIITPLYKKATDIKKFKLVKVLNNVPFTIPKDHQRTASYYKGELTKGITVYFVSHDKYFGRKKKIYGSKDENKRFYFFNIAALELLRKIEYSPDIIHCNDWHAGLIPELLKKRYAKSKYLKNAATVFTIHNLTFQFGHNWWEVDGKKRDNGTKPLPDLYNSTRLERINFAKRAIIHADVVNAVSETYAEEILNRKFGQDLHRILQNREHKLFGIVNGINDRVYNPKTDPGLVKNFDHNSLSLKKLNKRALQKKFNLPTKDDTPLIGMVGRLSEQKGLHLIFENIESLMRLDIQLIIWGGGDKTFENELKKFLKKYPKKFAANLKLTTKDVTQVFAGADIFLLPSRFEPCGLVQMEALRYGAIPVVNNVGGLADTIIDYSPSKHRGNGFVFKKYDPQDLLIAITRAVESYKHKKNWSELVKGAMKQSFSWDIPAKKYAALYKKAIKFKNEDED